MCNNRITITPSALINESKTIRNKMVDLTSSSSDINDF